MSEFSFQKNIFVTPTPAGAYFASSFPDSNPARNLLSGLMLEAQTQPLTQQRLQELLNSDDSDSNLELLGRAQNLKWLEGEPEARSGPSGDMDQEVPELLAQLSDTGSALLADADGFYLARSGIAHETAEELSALSADVASLHTRHKGLLANNLGMGSSAWALVDAAGNSRVGIWPIWVAEHRFALVLMGEPRLNQPAYRDLVWALWRRYGVQQQVESEACVS